MRRFIFSCLAASLLVATPVAATPLYDNGPLVNSTGTGAGGADESVLQTSLGMGTYGWGHQVQSGNRIADDFTVPAGPGWSVASIDVYAYQTGSSSVTSPFTAVNMQIWDGQPGLAGSSVIWGDTTTNLLASSVFSSIYRVTEATSGTGNTDRPIFRNELGVSVFLTSGTYWLDWQADGALSSGPWAPPITINGQTVTGNALQFTGSWNPVTDVGPQGFPFIINGPDVPEPGTLTMLAAGLVALGIGSWRRRRAG